MSVVDQILVTGANQKIQVTPDQSLIKFVVLNDSPYDAWVSFGSDPGVENYLNSDIHVTPTSYASWDVTGNTPTIGNARWGRIITVYTTIPLGGNIAPTPSGSQIIISGFGVNEKIPVISTLSRNVSIGNNVPLGTSANSIVNDGNAVGTVIVESTVTGGATSGVHMENEGYLRLGTDATHFGSIGFVGQATNSGTYQDVIDFGFGGVQIGSLGSASGQLQLLANGEIALKINSTQYMLLQSGLLKICAFAANNPAAQVWYRSVLGGSILIDASDDKNMKINVPNVGSGGKLFIQVGGVNVASIDGSGNMILKGSLTQNGTP